MIHVYFLCKNSHEWCHTGLDINSLAPRRCVGKCKNVLNLGETRTRFLSLPRSNLRLCSANHRTGYWSNLPCDWPSTAWVYCEQETENEPWKIVPDQNELEWGNILRPKRNGHHFLNGIFKLISLNENIVFWLEYPRGLIINMPTLVQMMVWRQKQETSHYLNQCWPGLLPHICVTRPHWVKSFNYIFWI